MFGGHFGPELWIAFLVFGFAVLGHAVWTVRMTLAAIRSDRGAGAKAVIVLLAAFSPIVGPLAATAYRQWRRPAGEPRGPIGASLLGPAPDWPPP